MIMLGGSVLRATGFQIDVRPRPGVPVVLLPAPGTGPWSRIRRDSRGVVSVTQGEP